MRREPLFSLRASMSRFHVMLALISSTTTVSCAIVRVVMRSMMGILNVAPCVKQCIVSLVLRRHSLLLACVWNHSRLRMISVIIASAAVAAARNASAGTRATATRTAGITAKAILFLLGWS